MNYKYDNPEAAYKEANRRINKAKSGWLKEPVTELNLRELGLADVPPEITQLTNLEILKLGDNKLTNIPPEIAQLTNLEWLELDNNQLTTIPCEIAQLTNLLMLYLHDNQLTTIPPEFAQLTKLKVFDLRNNPNIPIPLENVNQWSDTAHAQSILDYLQALDRIQKAKDESATELDLNGLRLTAVPPEITQLMDLKILKLEENKLKSLPPEITQLTNLEVLLLNVNELTTLPSETTQLTNLKILFLGHNKLSTVPSEITHLTNLKYLFLNHNQLKSVPPEITRLTNLEKLDLYSNRLRTVPIGITQLTSLQYLNLGGNQLTNIPPEIAQLTNLQELALYHNQVTEISPEFVQLNKLELLSLDNNQLAAIPYEFTQLTNLKELWLHNNPDLSIPPEIVAQGENPQAILNYLREKKKESTGPLNEAKLILVGQGNVGKTSLVKRLLGMPFDEHEDETKGICIESWELEVDHPTQGRVPIALNIWDFGGQEIMHATHQFFLTERSLYLLVLDARQDEDEGWLEYWLSLINSFADDAPVLVVINKIDQQRLDINRRGLQQKYPAIKGFVPTSARTGEGTSQLKMKIAAILAEMPHIDTPFPASWQRVKETLITMQTTRHFLPYQEYEMICHERGVKDESAQRTLVRFLHDLGIVLNFQDDPRVRETSVLNPHWVTDGVYTLLNSPELQKQRGILGRDQLDAILPTEKYPPSQHRFLMDMMRKFELAYEMDWHSLLIPDLLAKEEPDFDWNNDTSLQFAYQYQILPRSILHRFMVRQYHLVDPDIRWRTGVMLRYDGLSALVKADIKAATIRIAIKGAGDRRQFLYSLRLSFAGIHEAIAGIQPKEVVPIPGHPEAPPLLYSYLEKLEAMNMPDEQLFPGMDEVFSVKNLLNGVTTSAMRQSGLPSRTQILDALRTYFDKGDFYELLFALDIDRDKLAGESVDDQKRECVLFMERNGRLAELIQKMKEERPHLDFRLR